jgi:outer membrane protein assembly factor BamB
MKNKIFTIIITISVLAILLTACTGTATSWGGATIDSKDATVYYANGVQVYSLETGKGDPITNWTFPSGKGSAARLFLTAPTIIGNQVLLGDQSNVLTSVDIKLGTETPGKWPFKAAKGKYIAAPLEVNDKTIIAANADGYLYALDLTGDLLWTYPVINSKIEAKGSFWAQPISDGTTVYAPSMDHFLYAIDLSTHEEVWKLDLKAPLIGQPALDNGILYIGNLDGDVFAVDTKAGLSADERLVWKKEVKVAGGIWSAPIVHESKLFVGDQKGNINILNTKDGTPFVASVATGSAIIGSGVLLSNGVVFGNEKGELILTGFDGSTIWNRTVTTGSIYSNLATDGNSIIVIAIKGDHPLIAFDTDGKQSWFFPTATK